MVKLSPTFPDGAGDSVGSQMVAPQSQVVACAWVIMGYPKKRRTNTSIVSFRSALSCVFLIGVYEIVVSGRGEGPPDFQKFGHQIPLRDLRQSPVERKPDMNGRTECVSINLIDLERADTALFITEMSVYNLDALPVQHSQGFEKERRLDTHLEVGKILL
jgi:hypothetical protein